ncbi:MAG TPA: hypothetical protein VEA69_03405 [Tepidisphaeraceae bacterium]|nr:hypothetical protein [Tepidisphaeraceae bacterium]
MVKLEAGNVLLKPSHRRQVMGQLKRSQKLVERLGGSDLTITMQRVGHQHEVRAAMHDARGGDFTCRCRQRDWRAALRELVQRVTHYLHDRHIGLA